MSDAIHVTPCEKCGGWHPRAKRCPPRRRISIGLSDCKRCGGWHRTANLMYCSRGYER